MKCAIIHSGVCAAPGKRENRMNTENETESSMQLAGQAAETEPEDRGTALFIVNPIAGSGKCEEKFAAAEAVFKASGMDYRVEYTQYSGHAVELAKDAVYDGTRFIIAVGGDGTVREVVTAIAGEKGITFGMLPFGTGNDFASALGIPTEPEAAAELLLTGEVRPCDIGTANGSVFTNVCGLGFDVEVLRNTEKHKKGRSGMLPYALGIADSIFHRRKVRAHISIDGQEELELETLLIAICNGVSFGGGMKVAPEAKADDGLFDICIAKWVSFFGFIKLLPKFIKGAHLGTKPIMYLRGSSITIRTEGRFTVELDGELDEKTPLNCKLMRGALNIIRPAE